MGNLQFMWHSWEKPESDVGLGQCDAKVAFRTGYLFLKTATLRLSRADALLLADRRPCKMIGGSDVEVERKRVR